MGGNHGVVRFSRSLVCLIAFAWIAVALPASGQG